MSPATRGRLDAVTQGGHPSGAESQLRSSLKTPGATSRGGTVIFESDPTLSPGALPAPLPRPARPASVSTASDSKEPVEESESKNADSDDDSSEGSFSETQVSTGNSNDSGAIYIFHTAQSLQTLLQDDETYALKYPIILIKKRPEGTEEQVFATSLADELPVSVEDILAFNGYAVYNILLELIQDKAKIPVKITKMLFLVPETLGAQLLPAQQLFFMFFAQMIFFANLQKSGSINLQVADFETQYELIRKELEAGNKLNPKKFFGVSILSLKRGFEETEGEAVEHQLGWWSRSSVGAFICVNLESELDDLVDIFVLGPCAMLNFLHLEKSYFNTVDKELRDEIARLHEYVEANVAQESRNESVMDGIGRVKETIQGLRNTEGGQSVKHRFETMEDLKKEVNRRVQVDFDDLCSESVATDEDADSAEDGDETDDDTAGMVSSQGSGKKPMFPHGPAQPPGQAGLFDKMNWKTKVPVAPGARPAVPTTPGGRPTPGARPVVPTAPGGRPTPGARPSAPMGVPPPPQPREPGIAPGSNMGLPGLQTIQSALEHGNPIGVSSAKYSASGLYRVKGPLSAREFAEERLGNAEARGSLGIAERSPEGVYYKFTPEAVGEVLYIPERDILRGLVEITGPVPLPEEPGVAPAEPGAVPVAPGATPVAPGATPVAPGAVPVAPGAAPGIVVPPGGPRLGTPPVLVTTKPGEGGDRTLARPIPAADVAARVAGENMGMCGGGTSERRRTRKNRVGAPVVKLNL